MTKTIPLALLAGACALATIDSAAAIEVIPSDPVVMYQPRQIPPAPADYAGGAGMGGGFIEFLFGGGLGQPSRREPTYQPQPAYAAPYPAAPGMEADPRSRPFDPRYEKQTVDYSGKESPGTVVVDTPNKFLYLVEEHGKALRYGIGVGRPGFTWSGVKTISAKKEWPDWTPPAEMLVRRPDLPRHMEGGPENPLGARAMYLGSSLYRIHGSNEPWTIGTNVSSGCIRMRNDDVIDLYGRVGVGTKVVVI
jgi:lipoprotein-anchoring transpeptidase ErfK/SrfK